MSSVFQSVRWRNHNVLENIDEQDSPLPDKFRKRPSSSSLNTVRMSLRKRMPLKQVEININAEPDWSRVGIKEKQRPLQSMTVTAKNMFGAMSKVNVGVSIFNTFLEIPKFISAVSLRSQYCCGTFDIMINIAF